MKNFFSMLFVTMFLSSFNVSACRTSWLAAYMIKEEYEEQKGKDASPYDEVYCCGVKRHYPCPKENQQPMPSKNLENKKFAGKK